jgi:hypothetical protein
MTTQQDPEIVPFSKFIGALDPWLEQVVLIGGWAHRLDRLDFRARELEAPYCGSWSTTPSAGARKTWFEECEGHCQHYLFRGAAKRLGRTRVFPLPRNLTPLHTQLHSTHPCNRGTMHVLHPQKNEFCRACKPSRQTRAAFWILSLGSCRFSC